MNGLMKYLTIAILMAAASLLYGQPPGYRGDETAILPGSGTVTLALAWGEQLTPSPRYPKVVINLKESLVKYARAPVDIRPNFRLGTGDLMKLSIVLITTDSQFELTPTEIKNLRDYIRQGGLVVVDDAGAGMPNSSSGASMRKMIREIAGRGRFERIPGTHPIYQTPFRMDGPPWCWKSPTRESAPTGAPISSCRIAKSPHGAYTYTQRTPAYSAFPWPIPTKPKDNHTAG